jgi:hypothetical protein
MTAAITSKREPDEQGAAARGERGAQREDARRRAAAVRVLGDQVGAHVELQPEDVVVVVQDGERDGGEALGEMLRERGEDLGVLPVGLAIEDDDVGTAIPRSP